MFIAIGIYKKCEGTGEGVDQNENVHVNTLSPRRVNVKVNVPHSCYDCLFAFDPYSFPFLILLLFHHIETLESQTDQKRARGKCSLVSTFR